MTTRTATPVRQEWAEEEGDERSLRDRAWLWLDCRLGETVNVEAGNAWALEAHGELRHWRGVGGLYRIGDAGLLDLSGVGDAIQVCESSSYPGVEQMVVEFDNGIVLTVTVAG